MNRGKKLKQMRRFINKYGIIHKEFSCPPMNEFPPFRKGSYYAVFLSNELNLICSIEDIDKYRVYKQIVADIKSKINPNQKFKKCNDIEISDLLLKETGLMKKKINF